jgi:hypothetical protein
VAVAIGLVGLLVAYTRGILNGSITAAQRIDAVHLGVIALGMIVAAALIWPDAIASLQSLEAAGVKLKLKAVERTQVKQQERLDFIRLVLPALLPKGERTHLLNLATGQTQHYKSTSVLRAELRRMRDVLQVIKMASGDKHIGDTKNVPEFDLADYVRLSARGREWADVVRKFEQEEPES